MSLTSLRPIKSSGYKWLGDIPEQWGVEKFRYVFSESQEKIESPNEIKGEMLSVSGYRGIEVKKYEDETLKRKPSELINYRIVKPKQLVVNTMWLNYAGLGVSNHIGYVSPAYRSYAIRQDFNARFIHHLMRSDIYVKGYTRLLTGIRPNSLQMGRDDLMAFPIVVPHREEQQKIAQFLDYETAKIDALIDEQKRLIELLKEKRQAVISHAVTKGLNPDAPMKESGIEWLGEVPEHWSIVYSKYLFDFVTSGSRGWADYYSDEGSLFFRIANLTRDTIEPKLESVQNVTPPQGSEGERSRIKINDILFSITADLGSVCVADESIADGYVSQHVALARPSAKVNSSRWLAYALISDSSKAQILGSGYGGTKIQLSLNDVKEVVLVEPSKAEQVEIADYLDSSLAKMNNLLEQAESLISLLTERRSALISAAVTGKIDVRNWQPPAGSDTVDSNALVQTERHYG